MKVYIDRDYLRRGYQVFIYNESTQEQIKFEFKAEKISVAEGVTAEPSFLIPQKMWDEIMPSLLAALQDNNIIADSRASAAELKATKVHLQDMQKAFQKLLEK